MALAGVLVERADRQRARQLLTGIDASAGPDSLALAAALRARLALDEGNVPAARKELQAVRGPGTSNYGLSVGVMVDLAEARVLSAEGKRDDAMKMAQAVRDRMHARQLEAFELEAALVLAEIKHDRAAAKQLVARATKDRFLLIARKAGKVE